MNEDLVDAARKELPRWITICMVAGFVLLGYKACNDHVAHKLVEEELFKVNKSFVELLKARQSQEVREMAKKLAKQEWAKKEAEKEKAAEELK